MPSEIFVVGVSYRTAPIAIREKLAFPDGELDAVLRELNGLPYVGEAVLLSTCNRTDIYAATSADSATLAVDAAIGEVRRFLARKRGFTDEKLAGHIYERKGHHAVEHVFRVAS